MKISIVTATHNSSATIRDTIESILQQTHQDWELIIEDGLSQDDTLSIAREFESRCSGRMRIFLEKDEGLYDAMNRGIARATGDIVGILNSDDFYFDNHVLEDINKAMEDQTVDCIYGDLVYVLPNNKNRIVRIWKGSQYEKGAYQYGWHPAHPTFYAKRDFYKKLGGFNTSYAISADFELMLRFIEKAGLRNRYIHRYFVKMRMGGESNGNLRNIICGNRNILRAMRENGLKPAPLFILRRMMPKLWATIWSTLHQTND